MFKPMLANNTTPESAKLPTMASVKLEGVRAEFTPDGLFTRPMKKFGNHLLEQRFARVVEFCKEQGIYLEGEIYKHGMPFNQISGMCRKKGDMGIEELGIYLFDCYYPDSPNLSFKQRYVCMKEIVAHLKQEGLYTLTQTVLTEPEEVANLYSTYLDAGYEGIILKDPSAAYKTGRSTKTKQQFARIKDQQTWDGVVVDIIERMENLCESELNELGYMSKRQDKDMKRPTGLAAVAVVKCPDFDETVRVSLTRRIMDYEETAHSVSRKEIWDRKEDFIGKHIRWVGIPVKGMLPRSPRFDDWRTDLD